jgi:hypothetical protein
MPDTFMAADAATAELDKIRAMLKKKPGEKELRVVGLIRKAAEDNKLPGAATAHPDNLVNGDNHPAVNSAINATQGLLVHICDVAGELGKSQVCRVYDTLTEAGINQGTVDLIGLHIVFLTHVFELKDRFRITPEVKEFADQSLDAHRRNVAVSSMLNTLWGRKPGQQPDKGLMDKIRSQEVDLMAADLQRQTTLRKPLEDLRKKNA